MAPARCIALGYLAEQKLSGGFAEANPEALATGAASFLLPWSLLARPSRRKRRLGCSHVDVYTYFRVKLP